MIVIWGYAVYEFDASPGEVSVYGLSFALPGVVLGPVATAAMSGPSRTVLQRSSPERVHGRVMAADLFAGNAAMLVGTVAAGPVIAVVGVPLAVTGFALVAVAVGGFGLLGAEPAAPRDLVGAGADA